MPDALEGFLRQVERAPSATALLDGDDRWSYRRLADAAAGVAARLERAGVPAGAPVGLSVSRGWRVVAGILGIWLRGGAYVPIDPEYPARRRGYIARDSGVSTVLTDRGLTMLPQEDTGGPVPDCTAYVIYTSGSTGEPKGVPVSHANVAALLDSAAAELPAGPADVGTVFHSYCFDFSVWEIWRVLTAGGSCVFVPAGARTDPERFAALLAGRRVTLLSLVPSVFGNLVRALRDAPVPLPHLREVVLGGEAVDLNAARDWFRLGLAPGARLVNMYGITECTVHVTAAPLDPDRIAAFRGPGTPIGRPLPHLRVALLDGEMYVAGAGVAAGYLGRPGLTAERFIRRPGEEGTWYRTGDLARREPDGELVYLGRRDGQLQLRGHRIEPGEVEAALAGLPDVAAAGVALAANPAGEPVLAACYVPAGAAPRHPARLRAELRERLPAYLVPARLVPVERLPVTEQGKIDRAALAAAAEKAERVAPAGPWQELVAAVWADVLGYPPGELSAGDDFLELGGHSLAAGRVAGRLSRVVGARLPVRLLFDHPTLAGLAEAIAGYPGVDGGDRRAKAD